MRLAVVLSALAAAGCAGSGDYADGTLAGPEPGGTHVETAPEPLECVPYARARSGVVLFGDAATWWEKAEGQYVRRQNPQLGSVIVLTGYAGPGRGHVGVVTALVSDREIRLDHANWLGDGAIYIDDPVADVSPDNSWTEVRVWNPRIAAWGRKVYVVQGFIGPERAGATDRIAAR
jgi:hypothetical protein